MTEKIIGGAFETHRRMGFGFLESVYQNCLLIELRRAGLSVLSKAPVRVRYRGCVVGDFIADLLVEDVVLVELKSIGALHPAHEVQLVNCLVATGLEIGLLLNFGPQRVDVKRKYRTPLEASNSRIFRQDEQD